MHKTFKKIAMIGMISAITLLSACNATPSETPTPDMGPLQTIVAATAQSVIDSSIEAAKTQAMSTAIAFITQEAEKNPTATPVPQPTATQALSASPTSIKSTPPKSGGSFYPTKTKTPYTDDCAVISTSPKDYQHMQPGVDFDGVWTLKNTGKVTWNDKYYIKFVSGNIPHSSDMYFIPAGTIVGDTVEVRADFNAPTEPGTYVSNWKVINNDGTAFCYMYVAITVP